MFNLNYSFNFTPIPDEFITGKMTEANGAYVKVYVYALYLAKNNMPFDAKKAAEALHLIESDVLNALEYWSKAGVLEKNEISLTFKSSDKGQTAPGEDNSAKENEPEVSSKKEIKTPEESELMIQGSKELAEMCTVAQSILQKNLTKSDLQTIYWFYDGLGLSPEVISMLIEYCASKNKRSMKYIEKVAISWHENGITTMDAVEKYIADEAERANSYSALKTIFSVNDRSFSKKELEFLDKWTKEYKMSEDMVALAYEYCIMQTQKLSFPYMNAIIERWYNNNIFTIPDAEADHESFKGSGSQSTDSERLYNAGYDYNELNRLMRDNDE